MHNADPRRKVELLVHGTHTAAREIRFGMEEAILLAGIGKKIVYSSLGSTVTLRFCLCSVSAGEKNYCKIFGLVGNTVT